MNPRDIAKWAAKFARTSPADDDDDDDVPAPAAYSAPRDVWGRPGPAPARRGQVWGPPPETDLLVKPSPSAYADLLSQVPDLAPGYADDNAHREAEEAYRGAGLPMPEMARPGDARDAEHRPQHGAQGSYNIVPLAKLGGGKPN